MQGHFGLVLHVQVGDNSCYGEFSNPANQASSTWWVAKSGTLEQYVDADMAAWTEAAGNFTWDSVETEGTPDQPLTAAQIATLAKLYAWGHATYGWPYVLTNDVNGRGFGWHGMGGVAWGNHPDCPGDLRKAQRQQILDLAQGPTPVPTESGVFMIPSGCTDNGAVAAQIREWWTTYRSDPMAVANVNILLYFFHLPTNQTAWNVAGWGGNPDLMLANIIDTAGTNKRPQFVGAV